MILKELARVTLVLRSPLDIGLSLLLKLLRTSLHPRTLSLKSLALGLGRTSLVSRNTVRPCRCSDTCSEIWLLARCASRLASLGERVERTLALWCLPRLARLPLHGRRRRHGRRRLATRHETSGGRRTTAVHVRTVRGGSLGGAHGGSPGSNRSRERHGIPFFRQLRSAALEGRAVWLPAVSVTDQPQHLEPLPLWLLLAASVAT